MYFDVRKRIHVWQLVLVILAVAASVIIDLEVLPFRHAELISAPFLLISIVTALYGDYYAGSLSIVLGTVTVSFINYDGWHFAVPSLVRSIEFLIASTSIYYLAWRSRDLTRDSATLVHTIAKLEEMANKQSKEAKINKRNLEKLRQINYQLQAIVDSVMDDKSMWENSVKKNITKIDSKKSKTSKT